MSSTTIRKQTSFRLSEELLSCLQAEAKRHNRSLNNLVESILMKFISEDSNSKRKTRIPGIQLSIQEARNGKTKKFESVDDFFNDLGI